MPKTLEQIKSSFLSEMEAKLPDMISHKRMLDDTPYDDYIHMLFKTKKPYTMDEVLDMMENDAHLYIGFHLVVSEGVRGRQCAGAFAKPDNLRMYQFTIFSGDENLVTEVHVKVYESLEFYFQAIIGDIADISSKGKFKRVMPDEKILRIALSCSD